MDKEFLSQLFEVDKQSAKNPEIDVLERIPKLVNREEVQQALDGLTGSKVDLEFLEDFLSFNGDTLDATGGLIGKRIREASQLAKDNKTEEQISDEVLNRTRLISSIKSRYAAELHMRDPKYAAFIADVLEPLRPTGGDNVERPLQTIDELMDASMQGFLREAEDEAVAGSGAYEDLIPVASGKYTRIQDFLKSAKMQDLYEGLLKSKTKIAGVAAIGAGLAIFGSIRNKERTRESLSGPPLLPGGNPYERIPNTPMNLSQEPMAQGGQGMSYNVSVNGDQDKIQEFMSRARTSNKRSNARYYA